MYMSVADQYYYGALLLGSGFIATLVVLIKYLISNKINEAYNKGYREGIKYCIAKAKNNEFNVL